MANTDDIDREAEQDPDQNKAKQSETDAVSRESKERSAHPVENRDPLNDEEEGDLSTNVRHF
jgi:hypothetical protein